ncbi:histidine phosphatase family protein [Nocardioides litoris]|uniref:histidine phosphatase family protein n=1 Tax=Nocardioides litoris TaxID=1926648 RepID=UPI0011246D23|nr:histidine phosphatase family protein [Nocardioides litoris]
MGLVLMVRHGQASFGADDYDVLSPTGWEQVRLLGRWLADRDVVPTSLVRGGMRRHRETLEAMTEAAGWAGEVEVDPGWDEFDHLAVVASHPEVAGAVTDGLDRRAFQRLFEEATARWTAGEGTYDEPWAAFVDRTRAALDRVVAQAGSGRTVVVVTSGGVIGALASHLVDPDDDHPASLARRWARTNAVMVNSSITRVLVGPTGLRLLTLNEHPHLEGEHLTYR